MKTPADLAWKLMTQLREEVLAAQRIRAQIIGFKITFVTASAGVILAKANDLPIELIALPALAAIFFDSLIGSYGFSIKRIGHYCQHYIEPKLREAVSWPPSDPLWEEFMSKRESRQYLSITGNLGLTTVPCSRGAPPRTRKALSAVHHPCACGLLHCGFSDSHSRIADVTR